MKFSHFAVLTRKSPKMVNLKIITPHIDPIKSVGSVYNTATQIVAKSCYGYIGFIRSGENSPYFDSLSGSQVNYSYLLECVKVLEKLIKSLESEHEKVIFLHMKCYLG